MSRKSAWRKATGNKQFKFSNAREGRSKDKSHDLHPAYANVRIKSKTLEGAMTEFQRTHSDSDHEWAYVVDGSGFVHRYVEGNAYSVSVYSGSHDSTILHNHGIRYIEQEESYTSKASFFENDNLPTYNADNPQKYQFSGTRITRGQYRTLTGYVLNADVNGALNILRKSKLVNLTVLQNRGCVNQPRRIRIFWSGCMRVQTLDRVPNFPESPRL